MADAFSALLAQVYPEFPGVDEATARWALRRALAKFSREAEVFWRQRAVQLTEQNTVDASSVDTDQWHGFVIPLDRTLSFIRVHTLRICRFETNFLDKSDKTYETPTAFELDIANIPEETTYNVWNFGPDDYYVAKPDIVDTQNFPSTVFGPRIVLRGHIDIQGLIQDNSSTAAPLQDPQYYLCVKYGIAYDETYQPDEAPATAGSELHHYSAPVLAAARHLLASMQRKPWSDREAAARCLAEYRDEISRVRWDYAGNFKQVNLRMQAPSFLM